MSTATFGKQWSVPAAASNVQPTRDRVVAEFQASGVHLDESTIDVLKLVVSEVVTNAVTHADGPQLTLGIAAHPEELHVRVTDSSPLGPRTPRPPRIESMAESGRGLLMVNTLAKAWGVEPRDGGKTVWITLHRPSPARTQPLLTSRRAAALARLICDATPQIRVHIISGGHIQGHQDEQHRPHAPVLT